MITRETCLSILPNWLDAPADRYLAHPDIQAATIQVTDDPRYVYIMTGEPVPTSVADARRIVAEWREKKGMRSLK